MLVITEYRLRTEKPESENVSFRARVLLSDQLRSDGSNGTAVYPTTQVERQGRVRAKTCLDGVDKSTARSFDGFFDGSRGWLYYIVGRAL